MQVQQGDRVKAVILIVAIVGIMGFVLKTAFIRPQGAESPAPPATTEPAPAPAPIAANTTPPMAITQPGGTPQVSVTPGVNKNPRSTGINPFRTTVATKEGPGKDFGPGIKPTKPPKPITGNLDGHNPMLPGPETMAEAEFRLAGVLIDSPSVAIVTRGGTETRFLHVGSNAAYGYKISAIRPTGIQVSQKKEKKWIHVGEALEPPMIAPPAPGMGY